MSSIWTPGGEHRVPPGGAEPDLQAAPRGAPQESSGPTESELAELRDQLARTPAAVVVTNHCLGLGELAALHLSLQPPQLDQAAVAIDALGAVLERLVGRLGEDESTLRDALAQLQVAFVEMKAASGAAPVDGG